MFHSNTFYEPENHDQLKLLSTGEFSAALDFLDFDFASPPYQNMLNCADLRLKGDQECIKDSPFASFRIFKDFATTSKKWNGEKIRSCESSEASNQKLSTIERIRIAGQCFIDCYSSKIDESSDLNRPLPFSLSGLSDSPDDETKDIDLLLTLLAAADKTGQQQYNEASKLVELSRKMSSHDGTPVERLVYYFSEAICEKINRETGQYVCEGLEKMQTFDVQKALTRVDASTLAFHQKVPLSQVCQFTSMYTILEKVGQAKHIHVIDLEIRSGMQYTVLMQAIASRQRWQLKHLKITAIGTRFESKIKDACNHLAEFARSMNIPFSFKIVMIADILDFNVDILELDRQEKVAVYSSVSLSSLIVKPNRLEHLMREIKKINPCVTIVTEVEANHTSVAFVNRFIDALFHYGALFDSMAVCLADDELNRKVGEGVYFAWSIRNIVAADGDDRTVRHTGIDVWRAFFARFGMMEVELSDGSLNEAKLLIDNFEFGKCCTIGVDGRSFLVAWNGVPIFSVSAWKFI
ncbi:hypothetical protein QVD17_40085 [Tagetes erecta]|uniref:Transcription factor GRAS n=1 Tax=Tagetes erecta TaxID=13708 RepID=A0AAD8JPM9_TARER|nr:hypothetical protein QVD17_40085 [Tagetes erecta]